METIGRPVCTETALVVSMTLPPPRATRPSASCASSAAASTPVISACGRAPWKRCATGSSTSCQSSSVISSGALTESSASTSGSASRPQRTIIARTFAHVRFPCTAVLYRGRMAENGRILTTHVGSLPRPQDVVDLVFAEDKGEEVDPQEYERVIGAAVKDRVQHQVDAGRRPRLRRRDEQDRLRDLHPPPPERLRGGRRAARDAGRPRRLPELPRPPRRRGRDREVPAPDLPRPDRLREPRAARARPRAPAQRDRGPAGRRRLHERAVAGDRRPLPAQRVLRHAPTSTSRPSPRR